MDYFLAFLVNFLATQIVNVARFARNVECDFFCDFQTLWTTTKTTLLSNISTTLKYKNPESQFDFLKLWFSKVQDLLGHPVQVSFMVVHLQFSVYLTTVSYGRPQK